MATDIGDSMVNMDIEDGDDDGGSTSKKSSQLHSCEIQVTFPTNLQAEQAMKVLQVDPEPTNRVTKSFRLNHSKSEEDEDLVAMVVRFESKELKMLRVAVSSFYDYLSVVLKTLQEFDTTLER